MIRLKRGSMGVVILVSVLLVLLIICAIWAYLIKTNKFINLGETLRPYLQDVPVLNMLLPEVPDESNPVAFGRQELEDRYVVLYTENGLLKDRIANLEKDLSEKNDVSQKYAILLREVDLLNAENASLKASQNSGQPSTKEELASLVKVYETMEASEAAEILEQIGTLNIHLVVKICREMKSAKFAAILAEMDKDFAAILSERMLAD